MPADGIQVHHEAHAPLGGITRLGAAGSSGSKRDSMDGLRLQTVDFGGLRCRWLPGAVWLVILDPIFEDRRICGCLVCEAARYEVYGLGLWEAIRDARHV